MATAINRNGGEIHVDYMLMPLTAEETLIGGDYLGARYAYEHRDRWINVNDLSFDLQTYDRGYTRVHVRGRTYQIHQDVLDPEVGVRLYVGKYMGTARDDEIGGLQTMDVNSAHTIFTWRELIAMGVITEATEISINYSKLIVGGVCKIGQYSGVRLVIPEKTTTGVKILGVKCVDTENTWSSYNFPARYICNVIFPNGIEHIGKSGPAFPMLGRNVVAHTVDLKIPKSVKVIGSKAFYYANIHTISGNLFCTFTSEDSLMEIGTSAFEGCNNLQVLRLGQKGMTFGSRAFSGCTRAKIFIRPIIADIKKDTCDQVGNVEYYPEAVNGGSLPLVATLAPFGAKLWNGESPRTQASSKPGSGPTYPIHSNLSYVTREPVAMTETTIVQGN